MRKRTQQGFSKVEIVVFVSIVIFCAVLALPNWKKAQMHVNQKSTVSALKTLEAAIAFYVRDHKDYPSTLKSLNAKDFTDSEILNTTLKGKSYHGYQFIYHHSKKYNRYLLFAVPEQYDETGKLCFVINVQGHVYEKDYKTVEELVVLNFAAEKHPLWNLEDRGLVIGGFLSSKNIFWDKTLIEE